MEWLFPSVIATFFNTFILSMVYLYLYIKENNESLKIFFYSWILYSLRFIFMIIYILLDVKIFLLFNQLFVLSSSICLLYANYLWVHEKAIPKYWYVLSIIIGIWIIITHYIEFDFVLFTLPTFVFSGIIYIKVGVIFKNDYRFYGIGKSILVANLIIWGIHKIDYPFLRPVLWFAPWGYLIGALCAIITAIGIILIYFEMTNTDLILKKSELADVKDFYENIIESIDDGIWVSDMEDSIFYTNRGMAKLTGISKEEIIGKNILNDFSYNIIGEFIKFYKKAKQTLKPTQYEAHVKTPEGKESFQIGALIPLVKNNSFAGMICTVHDQTEKKLFQDKLQNTVNEKDILLKEVQHRVKNNLTVLLSLLKYQGLKVENKEIKEIFAKLENKIFSIALIHTFLYKSTDLYKINFNEYLEELIKHLLISFECSLDLVEIEYLINEYELDIDLIKTLGLIINELITNSIKYAFDDNDGSNKIKLVLKKDEDHYYLIIHDNGKGIKEDFDLTDENLSGLFLVNLLCEEIDGILEINNMNGAEVCIKFPTEQK